jgi:hypothetical protein
MRFSRHSSQFSIGQYARVIALTVLASSMASLSKASAYTYVRLESLVTPPTVGIAESTRTPSVRNAWP